MLLHQARPFCLQIGDLLIDIFDFLLDVIVVLAKDFFRFLDIDAAGVAPFSGRLAVSFIDRPVAIPTTAITIR